jgi:hypothetical protein
VNVSDRPTATAPPPAPAPAPVVVVAGRRWERQPLRTHLIHIKEPLEPVFERYVVPHVRPGDWLAVSEKFVTISQGRVVHHSVVKAGWLARLVVRGVTKLRNDVGWEDPRKMQVAIMQTGRPRMVAAMTIGGVTRLLGRRGDFWRIAGHRVSEIDGFNPDTVKPFDEFAMLGPAEPAATAAHLADVAGVPVAIVDANNINVEVLGTSPDMPITAAEVRLALLDNPMGQNDELTPVIRVRPA